MLYIYIYIYIYICIYKVAIGSYKCAQAAAYIFVSRMDIFEKVSKFLRQKISQPRGRLGSATFAFMMLNSAVFSLNQVELCSLHVVLCSHSENRNRHYILQESFQLQLVTKQIKFSVGGRLCSGKSLLFWDEKYTFSVDVHPGFSMSINLVAHLVIIIDVLALGKAYCSGTKNIHFPWMLIPVFLWVST